MVPQWIETDEVKQEIAALSQQARANVPRLLKPSQVADAVIELVEDDTLAGRTLVMWCEEVPRLIDADRRE